MNEFSLDREDREGMRLKKFEEYDEEKRGIFELNLRNHRRRNLLEKKRKIGDMESLCDIDTKSISNFLIGFKSQNQDEVFASLVHLRKFLTKHCKELKIEDNEGNNPSCSFNNMISTVVQHNVIPFLVNFIKQDSPEKFQVYFYYWFIIDIY
jgi:hypothetical protein